MNHATICINKNQLKHPFSQYDNSIQHISIQISRNFPIYIYYVVVSQNSTNKCQKHYTHECSICRKNVFPTPSTKVIPVSPPYLPTSFMLFRVCISWYLCYLYLWMNMFTLLIVMGKVGYIALSNLMHNFIFIVSIKHDPLWLKLWY